MNTMYEAPPPGYWNHFLGTTMPLGAGGFYCVVKDNDDGDGDPLRDSDNQVLVYVTATLPDNTQRQIEVLVKYADPSYVPDNAIVVDGSILFNGTPDILGLKGIAHANGDIVLSGNPTFSVSANATGQIAEGGATVPPGGFNEGVPPISIPDVDPTQYRNLANYTLRADGMILDVATGAMINPGAGGWNGWTYSAASNTWSLSGNNVTPAGTYYAEGNVSITGSGNSPNRTLSIVAEKCISTTGNTRLAPALTGTLMIAGGDIKLGGTAGASYAGLIAAKEQIKTMGTFDHQGVLLAKNAQDVYTLVTAGSVVEPDSQFGGTMSVTYDGGMVTVLKNPNNSVTIVSARKLK
ncbi:MAG: hypothetical protein HYY17_12790 [Planctomycetes bacterium]|nr:hypothetical protein [Planctomycetota bacterium]